MSRQLQAAHQQMQTMADMIRGYQAELTALETPPTIRRAFTVHTGGMRGVHIRTGSRDIVVVPPPGGFADPDRAYQRIVRRFNQGRGSR